MPQMVFSLSKNVVGSTMLALPGGIAGYGDAPLALLPALIAIVLLASINAYYFSIIGRVCAITGANTYRQAFDRSVGWGGWIVAWTNALKAGFGILAGSMILADSFQELAMGVDRYYSRVQVLLVVTTFVLWPLCMFKDLRRLAPFSIVGVLAVGWTVAAMGIRWIDGTYDPERNGKFLSGIPVILHPHFGTMGADGALRNPRGFLLYIDTLATAYVAHYNAPRFYVELKQNSIARYNQVVGISYTLGALVYIATACVGFLTFGGNASGFILENYSAKDGLAVACRIAVDVSILLSYPLVFVGFRDGVLDIIQLPPNKQTVQNLNILSTVLLAFVTALAIHFTSLGLVLSFGGATFATAIIYVFPTLMFRKCVEDLTKDEHACNMSAEKVAKLGQEVTLSLCLMVMGIFLGCLGAAIALGWI